ncbi:hypothetical protein HDE_12180 [Halotydeus destructor]|nr:hypothetical protein HDE_12180 [Halotydeus destructor]
MGIAYQSCITIERYLSHPIKIISSFQKDSYVELPAASICIDYIPEELKVKDRYPDIYTEKQATYNTTSWQIWTQYLTLEQFISTTMRRSEAIKSCNVYATNMSNIDCTKWAGQRNDRISWFWKCFTLFFTAQQEYYLSNDSGLYRTENIRGVPWFNFDLNTDNYELNMDTSAIGVSIHHKDIPMILDEGSKTFRKFDFSLYNEAALAYTRQVVNRLEAPYPTKCLDYKVDGVPQMRAKLVNRCARQKFIDKTGYFPTDILTNNMSAYGKTKFASLVGHENAIQERYECNRLFPSPDCYTLNYIIDVKGITNAYLDDNDIPTNGSFKVVLFGPSEDTMIVSEQAAFLVFDMYSYLGNLFSLWLGVSVSGLARAAVKMIRKKLRRNTMTSMSKKRMKYTESRYYRCLNQPSKAASKEQGHDSAYICLVLKRHGLTSS